MPSPIFLQPLILPARSAGKIKGCRKIGDHLLENLEESAAKPHFASKNEFLFVAQL